MGSRPWLQHVAALRLCLVLKGRNDVAMGVSPWKTVLNLRFSPNEATRNHGPRIPVAPLGLGARCAANHGLTPVVTAWRPVGTESQRRRTRLVAEPHAQFAESAKLEQAIKANLKGLGYGG